MSAHKDNQTAEDVYFERKHRIHLDVHQERMSEESASVYLHLAKILYHLESAKELARENNVAMSDSSYREAVQTYDEFHETVRGLPLPFQRSYSHFVEACENSLESAAHDLQSLIQGEQ